VFYAKLGISVTIGVTYTDIDDRMDILHYRNLEIQALQLETSKKKNCLQSLTGEFTVDTVEKCGKKNQVIGSDNNGNRNRNGGEDGGGVEVKVKVNEKEKEIQDRESEEIDKVEHSSCEERCSVDSVLLLELFAFCNNCPKTRFFFKELLDDKSFDISVP
jgi:hypothetical protein